MGLLAGLFQKRVVGPRRRKFAPYVWPASREGKVQWHLVNFQNYIDEGFNANALIYSAIMYKVKAMIAAPLRAYSGSLEQPELLDPSRPLAQLVARPNPWQSWSEYHGLGTAYLNIAGDAFAYIDRRNAKDGVPAALYPMRPDRVYIVPKMGPTGPTLGGYVYVPEGRSIYESWTLDEKNQAEQEGRVRLIGTQNVMHVKLPNPGDPLEGMGYGWSPLASLARSADVDNEVTKFLQEFFQRGGIPPFAFSFAEEMDSDDVAEVREIIAEDYGGRSGWVRPLILPKGGKVDRIGMSFQEMGFEGIDERNETRILGPFGVPGLLIGTRIGLARGIRANAQELRRLFWEDTMVPETKLHQDELQYFLQGEGDEFVAFDFSQVPALRQDVPALIGAATQMMDHGTPPDIAYALVGLNVPPYPGSDIGRIPWNVVPVTQSTQATTDQEGAASAEDETRKGLDWKPPPKAMAPSNSGRGFLSEEQKDRLGRNFDNIAGQWEGRFEETAEAIFKAEQRHVLAMVTKAARTAIQRKATVNWSEVATDWLHFYQTEAPEVWRRAFMPLIEGVVTEQAEMWTAAFGMQFDVRNLFAEDWYTDYVMDFAAGVVETTEKDLRAVLQEGMAEGWSIPTMQKRTRSLFEQYLTGALSVDDFEWFTERMPRHRTEMIARTETIRASNRGSNELYSQWGVEQKEWLTTLDDRQCWFCEDMHGTLISVGGTFHDEGTTMTSTRKDAEGNVQTRHLKFNYEAVTSPPLHPNCILPGNEVAVPGLVAGVQSFYQGRALEIRTGGGDLLTVTPNHPIFTPSGWVAAGLLNEGDEVVTCTAPERIVSSVNPDYDHMPALVEEVFASLRVAPHMLVASMPVAAEDLHGDARFVDGNIDIVYPDSLLLRDWIASIPEPVGQLGFHNSDARLPAFARAGSLASGFPRDFASLNSPVGSCDLSGPFLRRHLRPLDALSCGAATRLYPGGDQTLPYQSAADARPISQRVFGLTRDIAREQPVDIRYLNSVATDIDSGQHNATAKNFHADTGLARQFAHRFASDIATEQIVKVRHFDYSGHVYDLQSASYALYTCNTIITSNCRCVLLPYDPAWEAYGIEKLPPLVDQGAID